MTDQVTADEYTRLIALDWGNWVMLHKLAEMTGESLRAVCGRLRGLSASATLMKEFDTEYAGYCPREIFDIQRDWIMATFDDLAHLLAERGQATDSKRVGRVKVRYLRMVEQAITDGGVTASFGGSPGKVFIPIETLPVVGFWRDAIRRATERSTPANRAGGAA